MGKAILFKVKKDEIDEAVRAFINKRIALICKKQKVDAQIQYEVDRAAVEITDPEYDARLMKIEKFLKNKFPEFEEVM